MSLDTGSGTGLAFARFSRSPRCIRFAERVQVRQLGDGPALLVEIHNERRVPIQTAYRSTIRCHWSCRMACRYRSG